MRLAPLAKRFDVVYANSQKAMMVGVVVGWLSARPVIWHLHDILGTEHFSPSLSRVAVALATHGARRVLANSQASANAFVAAGGDPGAVHVVYNGVDPARFESVDGSTVAELRTSLGLDGSPLVGAFSRLAPWKGQHVLVEALAELPGVHALVCGAPLFGEDDYAARLRQLAERMGVAPRVHFCGFRDDVAALMRICDIVVHTSVSPEPFGRVIVEAMMSARPVVATRAGGALEIVEDGVSGLLVAPKSPAELAAGVRRLLRQPGDARRIAQAGRESAVMRFSLDVMLAQIARHVDEVAGLL